MAVQQKTAQHLTYAVMALVLALMARQWWLESQSLEVIPYSEFQQMLAQGRFSEVEVSHDQVIGKLAAPQGKKSEVIANRVEPPLAAELSKAGVKYSQAYESNFLSTLLSWVLPSLIFFGLWYALSKRMGGQSGGLGGLLSIGKSRARVHTETSSDVTFADVAGVDEAKAELQEVVDYLREPGRYGRLGARIPKGILLVGPPGTGKTLLARAVAGEAKVAFFSISGSEFVEMFVGVGAARIRDLFEQARAKAPAIIFIDELDALGRARGSYVLGGNDEKEQTLNQLLAEMDGFDPSSGVVLLAATNRPEILDPALLRAGRFDRQVLVDRPDRIGRVQILKVHLVKVKLDPAVDVTKIAALTPGFSGADLANLVNEAALLATRRGAELVSLDDFTQAVERIVAGLEKKNRVLSEAERRIIAHHEMGHALVAMALPGSDTVHKVSIIPRGIGALGYTIQRPTEDRFLMTREELENKIAVLLGGRVAEELCFGRISTGAADDLAKATNIAYAMAGRYGMVADLGDLSYEDDPPTLLGGLAQQIQPRRYSEQTARELDIASRHIVQASRDKALSILSLRRETLEKGAQLLLEKETLTEPDLTALVARMNRP